MDDLERRLIELNDQLIDLYSKRSQLNNIQSQLVPLYPSRSPETNISQVNDIVIIDDDCDCECEDDDGGGDDEPNCCKHKAIVVSENYSVVSDDYYIGVVSAGPVTITLPTTFEDGRTIIVKAEMGPPLGNRKVTIVTDNSSQIDNQSSIILQNPYEVVQILYHDGYWNIISNM